jgi:HTH-type transcriptional regulator/antitoxin HigA
MGTIEDIRRGAPHVIHNDEQFAEYTRVLFDLTAKARPNRTEEKAIELLTLLIERYESEHYPIPDASPAEVPRFLLDSNHLAQRDLVPELGNEATVSLVLSGRRQLTRDQIQKLSARFNVSPAAFFRLPDTRTQYRHQSRPIAAKKESKPGGHPPKSRGSKRSQ